MARTPAQRAAAEKKALAADNKSEGMRSLFDAGYTVAEVKEVFGGQYGFAYGVATRWAAATGNSIPVSPREAKPKAAKTAAKAKALTAKAKPAAKAAAPVRSKAAIASAKRRAAAKAAKAK